VFGDTVYLPVAPSRASALMATSDVIRVCNRGAVLEVAF
tara:strand:+ start:1189 stop:1305 length:117 start_codon:yes stop_codon:yes gene_type:complete